MNNLYYEGMEVGLNLLPKPNPYNPGTQSWVDWEDGLEDGLSEHLRVSANKLAVIKKLESEMNKIKQETNHVTDSD